MSRAIVALILILLIAGSALGEASVWVVKTDSTEMYVGGTIHLLRESDLPLPAEYDRAYEAATVLVFETDLEKLESPEVQQKIMAGMMAEEGKTVDKLLSEEVYQELNEFCQERGVSLEAVKQMKVSMLILTLQVMEFQRMGMSAEGVDARFLSRAKADNKGLGKLETVDAQIDILLTMGEGQEDAYVKYCLMEMRRTQEIMETLIGAWKVGDLKGLYGPLVAEARELFPAVMAKLLDDRNRKWLPKLEAYLQSPETEFVLVGALHLAGDVGVFNMLEERGYTIEQLK